MHFLGEPTANLVRKFAVIFLILLCGFGLIFIGGRSWIIAIAMIFSFVFGLFIFAVAQQFQSFKRTDSMRREMIANISHDLRTPLTSLQGYLETLQLKKDSLTSEERERYLQTAIKQSHRLGYLLNQFLELAKLECLEAQPISEIFCLSELAQDVVQKFELAAKNRGVQLSASPSSSPHFVCADIGMIERVLVNLIDNALRYTPSGGAIGITLAEAADAVTVIVSDTGCGIAPDQLTQLVNHTNRQSKIPRRPSDSPDSPGLGLAIVKRILQLHGSEIQVRSEMNVGTTFTFTLPVVAPEDLNIRAVIKT